MHLKRSVMPKVVFVIRLMSVKYTRARGRPLEKKWRPAHEKLGRLQDFFIITLGR